MTNGFVQFTDDHGKLVTTNGHLTLIKENHRNLAFYGSRGHSSLSASAYDKVLADIGFPVVTTASIPVDSNGDDDTLT